MEKQATDGLGDVKAAVSPKSAFCSAVRKRIRSSLPLSTALPCLPVVARS